MSLVYFRKELVQNPVIACGEKVAWESLDGNRGVKALDPSIPAQAAIIAELRIFSNAHAMGVVEISESEAEALKKKFPFKPPQRPHEVLSAIRSQADLVPKVPKKVKGAAEARAALAAAGASVMATPKDRGTPLASDAEFESAVPTLEQYVAAGYPAASYGPRFRGRAPQPQSGPGLVATAPTQAPPPPADSRPATARIKARVAASQPKPANVPMPNAGDEQD